MDEMEGVVSYFDILSIYSIIFVQITAAMNDMLNFFLDMGLS